MAQYDSSHSVNWVGIDSLNSDAGGDEVVFPVPHLVHIVESDQGGLAPDIHDNP